MPQRISDERLERNIAALRALVDARSLSVVRDRVEGSAISGTRRAFPLPSIGCCSGKLTVTGYIRGARAGVKALIVRCSCGSPEYTVDQQNFKNFKSTRCNVCSKQAAASKRYWKYAQAMPEDDHRTRLLNRLSAAITRCHTTTDRAYIHYGARGITVFDAWRKDRTQFLTYVRTLVGWDCPELELDRTDTNRGYEPGNLRFVTRSVNAGNKRRIADLEKEVRRLRRALSRAEESLPCTNKRRTTPRS